MATPMRIPAGFTQDIVTQVLGQAGFPDPFFYHLYANDFDTFAAGDWTVTKVGTGTTANTAYDGGALLLTTTAGASDSVLLQLTAASFALIPATSSVAGKKAFFMVKFQLDSATLGTFHAGLLKTGTTPLASTDGIYFRKDTAAATVLLRNSATSVDTDVALSGVGGTVVAATDMVLGFYFDGKQTIYAFVNPDIGAIASTPSAASNGVVAVLSPAAFTSTTLNLSVGFTNGSAVARTCTIDFILAARER